MWETTERTHLWGVLLPLVAAAAVRLASGVVIRGEERAVPVAARVARTMMLLGAGTVPQDKVFGEAVFDMRAVPQQAEGERAVWVRTPFLLPKVALEDLELYISELAMEQGAVAVASQALVAWAAAV